MDLFATIKNTPISSLLGKQQGKYPVPLFGKPHPFAKKVLTRCLFEMHLKLENNGLEEYFFVCNRRSLQKPKNYLNMFQT